MIMPIRPQRAVSKSQLPRDAADIRYRFDVPFLGASFYGSTIQASGDFEPIQARGGSETWRQDLTLSLKPEGLVLRWKMPTKKQTSAGDFVQWSRRLASPQFTLERDEGVGAAASKIVTLDPMKFSRITVLDASNLEQARHIVLYLGEASPAAGKVRFVSECKKYELFYDYADERFQMKVACNVVWSFHAWTLFAEFSTEPANKQHLVIRRLHGNALLRRLEELGGVSIVNGLSIYEHETADVCRELLMGFTRKPRDTLVHFERGDTKATLNIAGSFLRVQPSTDMNSTQLFPISDLESSEGRPWFLSASSEENPVEKGHGIILRLDWLKPDGVMPMLPASCRNKNIMKPVHTVNDDAPPVNHDVNMAGGETSGKVIFYTA